MKSQDKSKYTKIAGDITKLIKSGKLKAGEKVPSETQLIANYGVSNTTARKALYLIESQGLVRRIRGKGTVVLDCGYVLTRSIGTFSVMNATFSENLIKDGYKPSIKILEQEIINGKVNLEISKKFYEINGKIFKLRVLRFADDILLKDEVRYFDANILKGIESLNDSDILIKTIYKKFGVDIQKIDRAFSAKILKGENNFGKNASVIYMEGAMLDGKNKPVELEKSYYNGGRYKFCIATNP